MYRFSGLKMPATYKDSDLLKALSRKIKISPKYISGCKVVKRSLDARNKANIHYILTVDFIADDREKSFLLKNRSISIPSEFIYSIPKGEPLSQRPVVVGFGPAGMFAALVLAMAGAKPIVIERGAEVDERIKETKAFFSGEALNKESNIQFGEGGAGTFSDGKLATGIKDKRIKFVLESFTAAGAPEEILYESKPHIGTDKLALVVKNIRKKIIELGGEIYFNTKLVDIKLVDSTVKGISVIKNGSTEEISCNKLILAIGHSARDTFEMINSKNIPMEPKPFAVGARIEHKRDFINEIQYGKGYDKALPTADYKLVSHLQNGRTVYSFCMCPGGTVVAAASEENTIVTNGMSEFKRDAENSNAAILVNVNTEDYFKGHVLDGVNFQREIERKAYTLAGETGLAPAQRLCDFFDNKESKSFGAVKPSYLPGAAATNLRELFPQFVTESMILGLRAFDLRMRGFSSGEAVLTGPETRSSSPVRIIRGENLSSIGAVGLYPCGEGAGYAGGITSAAVDGIKCAEMLLSN